MAGLRLLAANTIDVALAAATAKTVIQINAPTNQRLLVRRIGIFFNGASTTAIPVLIQALTKSTAGTSTPLTLTKVITSDPETIQSTAGENFTVEGTTGVMQDEWLIHPQMGLDITLAFAQELVVIGGARFALVMTAPASVSLRAKIFFDE